MAWLIDTDVLIDYLSGVSAAAAFLNQARKRRRAWVSVISVAEIYAGKSIADPAKAETVRRFLKAFRSCYIDVSTAKLGGELRRNFPVSLPDALIAASALRKGIILATRNHDDFSVIPDLQVQVPY